MVDESPTAECERLGGSWSRAVWFGPPHGEIGFRGHAGPIGFEGRAGQFTGCLSFDGSPEASAAIVAVPVGALTTGVGLRDQHMAAALRSRLFPVIRFEFGAGSLQTVGDGPNVFRGEPGAGWTRGVIAGTLELSGVRRPQGVTLRWRLVDSYLDVEGQATVSLAAYGISAPRFLWLQVADAIEVHFALRIPLGQNVTTMGTCGPCGALRDRYRTDVVVVRSDRLSAFGLAWYVHPHMAECAMSLGLTA